MQNIEIRHPYTKEEKRSLSLQNLIDALLYCKMKCLLLSASYLFKHSVVYVIHVYLLHAIGYLSAVIHHVQPARDNDDRYAWEQERKRQARPGNSDKLGHGPGSKRRGIQQPTPPSPASLTPSIAFILKPSEDGSRSGPNQSDFQKKPQKITSFHKP